MTRRLCLALDLIDDAALIAAYEAHHAAGAVWPEIVADIRARGILDMEIWRVADRLTMIMTVADDYPRDVPVSPRVHEWEVLMDGFQKRLAQAPGDEKWAPMTRIFALDQQP